MKYRLSLNKKENNSNMIFTVSNFDAISSSESMIDTMEQIAQEAASEALVTAEGLVNDLDSKIFDGGSQIKEELIPDMFDDIVIYETYDELPQPGSTGVIYRVNAPEDKAGSYYWNGSDYVPTYTSITPEEIDEVTGTIDSEQIDSMFI